MTTPLEREILTHYYCYPGPYRGGSENWSLGIATLISRFIELGLLRQEPRRDHYGIVANVPALKAYMDALAKVPLPVQQWVVPNVT